MPIKKIVEYLDEDSTSPFAKWFSGLNAEAAAKINTAIIRMENGNLSDVATVGRGVLERKINFGPGYRIYFGQDGNTLIILLGGGSKKEQEKDIKSAQALWARYKDKKKGERR